MAVPRLLALFGGTFFAITIWIRRRELHPSGMARDEFTT
jgi:hypothetical protein